jgi:hypothetical protein
MFVFLDFDGVLHPRVGSTPFQESCMWSLAQALAPFDVKLVIASTWRETEPFVELANRLEPLGKPVVGMTPILDDPFIHYVRYLEVREYLRLSGHHNAKWIGIDDTKGFYPSEAPVYWTNPMLGFVDTDIVYLQERLITLSNS